MLVESVATSIVVGKIRGGKIRNIGDVDIKGWYFFVIGFFLEFTSVLATRNQWGSISNIIETYFFYIHGFCYLLMFVGLIMNFGKKSMILLFIGTFLNFMVIMMNGGKMPVSGSGLQYLELVNQYAILKEHAFITHSLISESTKLSFLADIIPIPRPYPFPKMISIGDIFLALGAFTLIQGAMKNKGLFKRDIKVIDYKYDG